MRLLWLPTVLRAAGLAVYEVPGWQTRGGDTFDPKGGICHATAGSATSTDAGEINVLLYGSNSAPPPIAQLYLSRSGAFHVVASGRCNHALTGQPGTPLQGLGNANLIGIEAQNNNAGQAWTDAQLGAYVRGCAAIARKMGWNASRWIAHREHQPSGKTDPVGIDMSRFRADVAALIANPGSTGTHGGEDMAVIAQGPDGQLYFCIGGFSHEIEPGNIGDISYVAGEGVYTLAKGPGNNADWTGGGIIRLGWSAAVFGPVWNSTTPGEPAAVDLDALAEKVTARLAALRFVAE